ncbi:NmrA family transcriptional regulator [Nocardiopsis sp. HNM0947]|uniref:NmrA family transcriptional regulator n=1 Tax=Nocardiopsis coralli TaxID=2772213 RepID=A0ABR9P1T6_9ACTN|nr:NmrA family transcriptional regulator [Nocardiopsis coralli]MBE2997778.1 NmrA family transcriptional regulator [Nocardiopsis coralli]
MPNAKQNPQPILVTGGTGKTGRRVAARLGDLAHPVRLGSRTGTPPFSWEDPATWEPALEGVGGLYLSYQPDLAVPGAAETVGRFARTAADLGVQRVVLLSGRGEEGALAAERAVADAGAEWTVVRSAFFAQNFSESFLLPQVLAGDLALPVGGVREPFVDAGDIADVAVAALTRPGHAGAVYELTGPRALSFGEAAAEISGATGRTVGFTGITHEDFAGALAEEGVPAEVGTMLGGLFAVVLDGRNSHTADGVQRALGRPPKDFAAYAREVAGTGLWTP